MNSIDFTPLYRNSVGFDRLAGMLDSALSGDTASNGYPPYNIEALDDNAYAIVLAVAGFDQEELDIKVEKGVLTVVGNKSDEAKRNYLYQGISDSSFERKFSLADYVEVTGADLSHGLLTVGLMKEIPETMKPRTIAINQDDRVIEHKAEKKGSKAA